MEGLQEEQHINNLFYYGLGEPPASTSLHRSFGIVEAATPAGESYDSEGSMTADLLRQYHQVPFFEMVQSTAGSFQLLLRMQDEQRMHSAPAVGMEQQQQYGVVSAETDDGSFGMPPTLPPSSLEHDSCVSHVSEELQSDVRGGKVAPLDANASVAAPPVRRTKKVKREETEFIKADQEDVATCSLKDEKGKKPLERKQRKRSRAVSNKRPEEVESQRMSHIAVERNRRRLMNEHLAALRTLMPPSYIQRGDQASIVGGAIDFVKELEQHLQTLLAERHKRFHISGLQPSSWISHRHGRRGPFDEFFISPQYRSSTSPSDCVEDQEGSDATAAVADIEAAVTQTHVNLRVLVPRRPGQLLRFVSTLEEMHLSVLHLNVSSFDEYALYSLNLKMEDDCKLGSGDEVATAVHQMFSYITFTSGYS